VRTRDRLFLLEQDGVLVGDADFRQFDAESAEYAIMIGARNLRAEDWAESSPPMLPPWLSRPAPGPGVRDILPANGHRYDCSSSSAMHRTAARGAQPDRRKRAT